MYLGNLFSSFLRHDVIEPQVGLGATVIHWGGDKTAGTIIAVGEDRFTVQADTTFRVDDNDHDEEIEYEHYRNPSGAKYVFTRIQHGWLRGTWREGPYTMDNSVEIGRRLFHRGPV